MKTGKPSLFSDLQGAPFPLAMPVGPEENREGLCRDRGSPSLAENGKCKGPEVGNKHSIPETTRRPVWLEPVKE